MTIVKNYLLGYPNMYIFQDTESFHFSLDSILLPNFVTLHSSFRTILDIGTGNAPIPLVLTQMTNASITAVEIQESSYLLGKKSIEVNQKQNQINIIHGDIKQIKDQWESDLFDVITCNPPYFKVYPDSHFNRNDFKTIARHEVYLTLEQLLEISRKLLKNNGIFAMVHRPERLLDILCMMRKYNIEPKRIQFVYPKKGTLSNILLIEGIKNGKPGLKLEYPLIVHRENGEYTEELKKYVRGGNL